MIEKKLDTLVSLCKRRGFVYPCAEIYGGLNGVYDFGPLGSALKENIRAAWRASITNTYDSIVFLEGSLLSSEAVWRASGHIDNFHDPMIDCMVCKKRYRADDIDSNKPCPHCGNKQWTDVRQFNMMFKTEVGASADHAAIAYLRPETAQSIFINFKNIISTCRVKIPFGVAQIGKAFRNEITPKQFLFRMREFEQMEIEWFCTPDTSNDFFDTWVAARQAFYGHIGIQLNNIRTRPHERNELAHYSQQCVDVEYQFPFGWKELEGIAHRGSFDLQQHTQFSGKDLSIFDDTTKQSYIPHVVECSVGVDRLFLTLLFDAYHEDMVEGEPRTLLRFSPRIAPVTAAILPLTKTQHDDARSLYMTLKKKGYALQYDESGSIGKRYRRQDEIGTPLCITYDFDSQSTHTVTVRDRDTTAQERISIDQLDFYIANLITK